MHQRNKSYLLRKLLAIDGLFEGGRMFVGATSITYLISSGISLKEIAFLKSVQALVLILGELPSGILADSYGRKKSLILGGLCGVLGFLTYFFSSTLANFAIAEVLTALSLCFWSGAYESCVIDMAKLDNKKGELSNFFHLNMSSNSFAVMLFGLLGGYLGMKGINLPYLGASLFYLAMLMLIWSLPSEVRHEEVDLVTYRSWFLNIKKHALASIREGVLHPVLLPFFLANIAIQFLIQPLLHYWQPMFQTISPTISAGEQGVIFSLYCGTSALFGYVYSKFSNKDFTKEPLTVALLFCIFSILYFSVAFSNQIIWMIVLFILLQGFLALCRTSLAIKMNEVIESKSRASILSTLSLFSRIGMILALALIGKISNKEDPLSVLVLFKSFGGLSFILVFLLITGMHYSKKNKK